MSAAEKALAALEAAGKAATPRPWWIPASNVHRVLAGPEAAPTTLVVEHPREDAHFGSRRVSYEFDDTDDGTRSASDRLLIVAAVNLSAPLAAVARAAMAYRNAEAALDDSHRNTPDADRALLWSDRYVALAALFSALDALEAAAEGVV